MKEKTISLSELFTLSFNTLQPFQKESNINSKLNYNWNIAYQNLRHNKVNSIKQYATLFNLIHIMGALYILNIYFLNNSFYLGNILQAKNFDNSLGFKLFLAKTHHNSRHNTSQALDSSFIYYIKESEEYINLIKEKENKLNNCFNNILIRREFNNIVLNPSFEAELYKK